MYVFITFTFICSLSLAHFHLLTFTVSNMSARFDIFFFFYFFQNHENAQAKKDLEERLEGATDEVVRLQQVSKGLEEEKEQLVKDKQSLAQQVQEKTQFVTFIEKEVNEMKDIFKQKENAIVSQFQDQVCF